MRSDLLALHSSWKRSSNSMSIHVKVVLFGVVVVTRLYINFCCHCFRYYVSLFVFSINTLKPLHPTYRSLARRRRIIEYRAVDAKGERVGKLLKSFSTPTVIMGSLLSMCVCDIDFSLWPFNALRGCLTGQAIKVQRLAVAKCICLSTEEDLLSKLKLPHWAKGQACVLCFRKRSANKYCFKY